MNDSEKNSNQKCATNCKRILRSPEKVSDHDEALIMEHIANSSTWRVYSSDDEYNERDSIYHHVIMDASKNVMEPMDGVLPGVENASTRSIIGDLYSGDFYDKYNV